MAEEQIEAPSIIPEIEKLTLRDGSSFAPQEHHARLDALVAKQFAENIKSAHREYQENVGTGQQNERVLAAWQRQLRHNSLVALHNFLQTVDKPLQEEGRRVGKISINDGREQIQFDITPALIQDLAAFPDFTPAEEMDESDRELYEQNVAKLTERYLNPQRKPVELVIE